MDTQTLQAVQMWASVALAVLTAITLGVLIRYMIDTFKLRKAAERQVEQAFMPILTFLVEKRSGPPQLFIANAGSGPAFNAYTVPFKAGDVRMAFHHKGTVTVGSECEIRADIASAPPEILFLQKLMMVLSKAPGERYASRTICTSAAGKWYQSTHSFEISTETRDLIIRLEKHEAIPEPQMRHGALGYRREPDADTRSH